MVFLNTKLKLNTYLILYALTNLIVGVWSIGRVPSVPMEPRSSATRRRRTESRGDRLKAELSTQVNRRESELARTSSFFTNLRMTCSIHLLNYYYNLIINIFTNKNFTSFEWHEKWKTYWISIFIWCLRIYYCKTTTL